MKKLDKLILKSFTGPFLLTFVVVVFILLTQTLIKYFDEFVGKGLDFSVFAQLIFYFSINTTPVALPLAVLLSSLITFGNLGQHYELTAIKSAGISLVRVLFPIFVFTIALTFIAFWFNNTFVPKANLKAYSLLWDIRQKKPTFDIKEGVFYNGLTSYSIKANKKLADERTLIDLMIYDHTEGNGNTRVILADTGKMYTINQERYLVFELFNGESYTELTQEGRRRNEAGFQRDKFEHSKMVFSLASFDMNRTKEELFAGNRLMKNVSQLQVASDSMRQEVQQLMKNTEQSASQYYFYRNRNNSATSDSIVRSISGSWTDSLQAIPPSEYNKKEILSKAANQARNLKSFFQNTVQQKENTLKESRSFDVEKHGKFAQSIACLMMFLIGAPLGAIIKKGGLGVPVLVSITFFIFFYVLSLLGQKWAKEGMIWIPYGVYGANFILFWIGLFFLKQARNDSRLFDADIYKIAFNRLKDNWKNRHQMKEKPVLVNSD